MQSWPYELLLLRLSPRSGKPFQGMLLIILALLLSAGVFSQPVTLHVTQAPLEKACALIARQTGFRLIYTRSDMRLAHAVSIRADHQPLDTVLRYLFANQPLTYIIETRHIVIRRRREEPPVTVTQIIRGKVVNEEGEPLEAVSVVLEGTPVGTSTGETGEFSIEGSSAGAVLIFSSIGYESAVVPVQGRTYVLVKLIHKLNDLDESVVMAYGQTTHRLATSTIGTVRKKQMESQPVSNPLSTLTAQIPGLQITQTSGTTGSQLLVRLRGQNSLANGNDPLIIIDGMPYPSNSFNQAPGAGSYLSPLASLNPDDIERIEVLKDADATAIYGSRGANGVILITTVKPRQGKLRLGLKLSGGIGKATRFMHLLDTEKYLEMRKEAFSNDGRTPTTGNAPDLLLWDSAWHTNWQKELLGNTMKLSDAFLSMQGGTGTTQFLFGIGRHRETTVLPWDDFGQEKYSGNLRVRYQSPDGKWEAGFKSNYYRSDVLLPQSDVSYQIFLPPNAPPLYKPDGSLNWENSSWINPISLLYQQFNALNETFMSDIRLAFRFWKKFELSGNLGYNRVYFKEHSVTPEKSFNPVYHSTTSAGFGNNALATLISEPQLNYSTAAGELKIDVLLGSAIQQSHEQSSYAYGYGYLSDDLMGCLGAASTISMGTEHEIKYRYFGLFGRIQLNWKSKYLLSLTGRRDGSSRYGPAHRFSNFGSAAAAWIFSKEKALSQYGFLSFGKLKVSYGTSGNDQIGDYNYVDLFSPYPYHYLGIVPVYPTRLYNPDFSWELVKKLELGLDIGLFKDRLILNARYYRNLTSNQLITYALPATTGFSGILKNLPAVIRNSGIELELSAVLLNNGRFRWSMAANASIPSNKLIRFDNLESSSYANTYIVGQSLFISRRYALQGVDPATGNYSFVDFDKDGRISSPNDRRSIVFTGQQWYGGIRNEMTWRNWQFTVLAQWVRQKAASDYTSRFGRPGSFSNQPDLVLGRWQNPGDMTNIQKFVNSNGPSNIAYNNFKLSDGAFSDASFIRIRNCYISYDAIPAKRKNKSIPWLKIFLQAENLFTFTSYRSLDPETKTVMPPVKIIAAGLQVGF